MHRRTVLNVAVVAAVAGSLAGQGFAAAAKPKAFKKSFTYRDVTADPTATDVQGGRVGCDEKLAPLAEKGFEVSIPAKGTFKVVLSTTGDWALDVRDAKGRILGSSDGSMPTDQEAVTVKIKTAGKYFVVPCNIGGGPDATGTYEYKPS